MSFLRKLFAKPPEPGPSVKETDQGDGDPGKRVIQCLGEAFGDFVVHYGSFSSINDAKVFLGALSFMTISGDKVLSPKNIQVNVIQYQDATMLFIGGQFDRGSEF